MNLNTILDNKINALFNDLGIKLVENSPILNGLNLPNKSDLKALFGFVYNERNENSSILLIKNYIFRRNHFRIVHDNFLLFEKTELQTDSILNNILKSAKIMYIDNKFRCTFPYDSYEDFKILLLNKEFIEQLPKEFQLKAIFSSNELFLVLGVEIKNLIEERLTVLGVKEKSNIDLPKLIMDNLNE